MNVVFLVHCILYFFLGFFNPMCSEIRDFPAARKLLLVEGLFCWMAIGHHLR